MAGCTEIECEAGSVADALSFLKKNFKPELNALAASSHIYLNADNITFLKGVRTRLKNGDVLHIIPPTAGG